MNQLKNDKFKISVNENNNITFLGIIDDLKNMNWVEGKKQWGTVVAPKEIEVNVERKFLENGNLQEVYQFKNISKFPIGFKNTDIGVYTTFNDNYEDAETCIQQKCHTHIFCGGEASYIMALQMGGRAPHIGLKVTKGSIVSYSVERDLTEQSNDRGDFILHPNFDILQPNETVEIIWEIFLFNDKLDFKNKLLETKGFPVIKSSQFTYFLGETINLDILVSGKLKEEEISLKYKNENIPFTISYEGEITKINSQYLPKEVGSVKFDLNINNRKTYCLFYICKPFLHMVEDRCKFIVEKQQYNKNGSVLDGAYLIYDNEENKQYYSHLDDHNGGRERICMAILITKYLQIKQNDLLLESLKKYINYFYRELYDCETGVVYNDVTRNLDWNRLYNYPWVAVFQLELYNLFKDVKYLKNSFNTMQRYYDEGGKSFYGIAIPAVELFDSLKKESLEDEANKFFKNFVEHSKNIIKNGLNYPPFEVRYEQSIVAPAISCLLQAYTMTNDNSFLEEAKRQLNVLDLFNGEQANYYQYEVSIRHWDGKWFGKYGNYGDTYPHYWSSLTGIDFLQYGNISKDEEYITRARASFRGCLNLFRFDGGASCAMVYPQTVNGKKGHYYDPWANDQDWCLYFALKYKETTMDNKI